MKFGTIHYMGLRLCRFWLLYKNNAQKCTEKWAYLKNGLSYSLVAWRGCYYQQSPAIATFTYAKGWKKKIQTCENFQEYSTLCTSITIINNSLYITNDIIKTH